MSITYNITTDFGAKDSLPSTDPDKVIKGAEFTTEYQAIKTAFTLAAPTASPTFTGTVTLPAVNLSGDMKLDNNDSITWGGTDTGLHATDAGGSESVKVKVNNVDILTADANGVDVTGELESDELILPNSGRISYTSGGDTYILGSSSTNAISTYCNNSLIQNITTAGVTVTGKVTSDEFELGNDEVFRWGTDCSMVGSAPGNYIRFRPAGVNKLEVNDAGITVTGTCDADTFATNDDGTIEFGDSTCNISGNSTSNTVTIETNDFPQLHMTAGTWAFGTTSPQIPSSGKGLTIDAGSLANASLFLKETTNVAAAQISLEAGELHFDKPAGESFVFNDSTDKGLEIEFSNDTAIIVNDPTPAVTANDFMVASGQNGNDHTMRLGASGSACYIQSVSDTFVYGNMNINGARVDLQSQGTTKLSARNDGVYYDGFVTGTGTAIEIDGSNKLVKKTSSRRYKDHINYDVDYGLAEIEDLCPVTFEYKTQLGKTVIGLIAEDVEPILPEVVQYTLDGTVDGLDYTAIVPVLIKAVQELSARVEELEGK